MNKFPNKRMIYIRPKNLEFFNSLKNRSKIINEYLELLQADKDAEQLDIVEEVEKLGRAK